MTTIMSDDDLSGQQSRIMNAMRANAQPSQQQVSPQDLLQAMTIGNSSPNNATGYFDSLKQAQTTQASNNLNAEQGIYAQMKEQVARGNSDAAAVDKAITDVAGDDPKIYAGIAAQLHADPEKVTPANVRGKVMKYASEQGINPLFNQEAAAKVATAQATAAKTQGEANQLNIFNPTNNTPPTQGVPGTNAAPAVGGNNTSIPPTNMSANGRNDDYLNALPMAISTQVKALADGKMQFPSGMAIQKPYWQQMLQAVGQYDPSFDAVNYNARSATRKDFTSGKSAQNITSLNTAIGHLDALDKAFAGLKNSDYPIYNSIANAVGRNIGNTDIQTAVKDVNSKAIAVSGELAKVFRSTGMSQKEIEDWKDQISPNNSPAENKKVIESAIDLMNSRLDAVGEQYNKGMGTTADSLQLLSPKAQKIIQRLQSTQPEEKIATGESIRTASEPIPTQPNPDIKASSSVTIGDKSYVQQNGKWYEK